MDSALVFIAGNHVEERVFRRILHDENPVPIYFPDYGLSGSPATDNFSATSFQKRLGVVGMMYDVVSGEVHVIDETRHGV